MSEEKPKHEPLTHEVATRTTETHSIGITKERLVEFLRWGFNAKIPEDFKWSIEKVFHDNYQDEKLVFTWTRVSEEKGTTP